MPKVVPKPPTNINPKPPQPKIDREQELKNVRLKPVVKEENKGKNIGGEGKNFLQEALSTAIRNRRQNLHMHDDEDDDDEDDDDWD